MLGELGGHLLGGILRLVGYVLVELVLEIMVRGPGHALLRALGVDTRQQALASLLAGLVFWGLCILLIGGIWHFTR
jgi:hypothetical protein